MFRPVGWVKFWKPKDDWYYLQSDDRQVYLDAYIKAIDRAQLGGARLLGSYRCRGQSEWARFELWEFPDLQSIIDLTNELEEIGHFQYFAESNTVGRRYERNMDAKGWAI